MIEGSTELAPGAQGFALEGKQMVLLGTLVVMMMKICMLRRCGVRLYREQKRAQSTDDRVSLNNDGWDDSSSCTNSADSQPAPVSFAVPGKSRTLSVDHADRAAYP